MGFLNNSEDSAFSGSKDKLDLVEFESSLVNKFNDTDILNVKYKAEEFGVTFIKREGKSDVYQYEGDETITICPEPLEFIKEFDDVSDNTSKADALFVEKMKTFKQIHLDKKPLLKGSSADGKRMWMNKTLTGINLRPGNLNDDRDNFTPVRMCDDNVHGLIVGRTGAGKSVFINALILSLITEYSPWELNLYLADFKKVELSRYMNNADEANNNTPFTPHVNACAATSEIRYVKSLIQYLVDCMNARQEFFARLGVTKIQEFRNKYNLVLPRVLLMVDEFQQLFTEATNREAEEIQTMLNSITKLGRATGFHLIFASQEMSGTLRGNTLANFKIRMALPCNKQISVDILGNGQAVDLERGYVLVNTDSGDELKNQKYRVPFIETDKKDDDDSEGKTPFYAFLDEIKLAGKRFELDFKTSSQKFYREELQESEIDYRKDLDRIKEKKNALVAKNQGLFDAVVLGKTVLYSPKQNDKVSFYIERGRNKGVMIACPDVDNAARIRKLLTENLMRSDVATCHFGMEINNLVLEKYRIEDSFKNHPLHTYHSCDIDNAMEYLQMFFYLRQSALKIIEAKQDNMEKLAFYEEKLITLLENPEKVSENQRYQAGKEQLEKEIADMETQMAALNQDSKKKITNPIIKFLEKCSNEIIIIPVDKTKVDLTSLKSYDEIRSNFAAGWDIVGTAKKNLTILDRRIDVLSKLKAETETEAQQNALAILRNKIFRRAIVYFVDRYNDQVPEKVSISGTLDNIYATVQSAVSTYKKEYEAKKAVSDDYAEMLEEKNRKQDELEEMEQTPNEITVAEADLRSLVNAFISTIFDAAYTSLGYRKNKPAVPKAEYILAGGKLEWNLVPGAVSEEIEIVGNDILKAYIGACRGDATKTDIFRKIVFWINGMDEIEKVSNQLVEVIRNAINQNILVIAVITSELRDTTIRKAFDYAFVTGNLEKFYLMFNIKYTKQPLDSIVVNFGIRSKGFDIPFKMYKSNLGDIQAPDFIDQLLND